MLQLIDYNYILPEDLIAQTPADPPESCKFLVYDKENDTIQDHIFSDITQLIDPHSLMVFNNSKVLKARIPLPRINGEIFYLEHSSPYRFNALIRPGKKFKIGSIIYLNEHIFFTVDKVTHEGRQLTCNLPIIQVLEKYGQMPLPPYISYDESKEIPYQPVFAEKEGSVASPTASLHFTSALIDKLEQQGVETVYTTLHVGLGTFKQVDTEDITQYDIHSEIIEIEQTLFTTLAGAKKDTKKVVAVGTTVTRTLESLPYLWKVISQHHPESIEVSPDTKTYRDELTSKITLEEAEHIIQDTVFQDGILQFSSKLFLYPGKSFYLIDQLITNFHLPKSSLLMLVAGFIGHDNMKKIYDHAIDKQYRFYSFGDAMWIK